MFSFVSPSLIYSDRVLIYVKLVHDIWREIRRDLSVQRADVLYSRKKKYVHYRKIKHYSVTLSNKLNMVCKSYKINIRVLSTLTSVYTLKNTNLSSHAEARRSLYDVTALQQIKSPLMCIPFDRFS